MSSNESVVGSSAFQREALLSERLRIRGILVLLGAVAALLVFRVAVFGGQQEVSLALASAVLLTAAAAYEIAMLRIVQRSIRDERTLPSGFWKANIVVESLLPTVSLLILTESDLIGPYRALVAPVVMVYFFFITFSTLRLDPGLARLTGLVSAIGYALVVGYTVARFPTAPDGSLPLGKGLYLTYVLFLLAGGFIAGEVARQIRKHVTSALSEALQKERVQRDLEVARSVQQGLLPAKAPEIPGFDIAGWNLPADETGGDFYYWEGLGDGRTSLVLADVTGHGIGAALIASLSRAYGRACVTKDGDLGASLNRMDGLLGEDLPAGKLVNFVSAVLDAEAKSLQLLSAGQGPLLVYRAASREMETFKAHGVPLGVGLGLGYPSAQQVDLGPGDMVILTTDGFFEWENAAGEQFGIERMNETIRHSDSLPAQEIISALHAAVLQFAGGTEQMDDLTAVIVKREPTN